MIDWTLPPKFGQAIPVDVEAIYRRDGILEDGLRLNDEPVTKFSGPLKKIVKRVYRSLTKTKVDDMARIYVLPREKFETEYCEVMNLAKEDGFTIGGKKIDLNMIGGLQSGPQIFMPEKSMTLAYETLFHELGGTLIPARVSAEEPLLVYDKSNNPSYIQNINIHSLESSVFFLEVAHHYLQYAGLLKYNIEIFEPDVETNITQIHDLRLSPIHYHAAKEALRLLQTHTSPLRAHPQYYDGTIPKTDQIIAMITDGKGVEKVQWIGPEHPAYHVGGIITIRSLYVDGVVTIQFLDDLCTGLHL